MGDINDVIGRLNNLSNRVLSIEGSLIALKNEIELIKNECITIQQMNPHLQYRVDLLNPYGAKDKIKPLPTPPLTEDEYLRSLCTHKDSNTGASTFIRNGCGSYTCSICGKTIWDCSQNHLNSNIIYGRTNQNTPV